MKYLSAGQQVYNKENVIIAVNIHVRRFPSCIAFFSQTAVNGDRFEIVCDGCNIECEGCNIEDNHTAPVCTDLLDHTDSQGGIATLETLILDPGYWRATNRSRIILACFHKEACNGGLTEDPEYCLKGYEGPCEKYPAVGPC